MYMIQLKGVRFYAFHGLFAEEAKLGQEFIIDLVAEVMATDEALESDDMTQLLNYADVLNLVEQVFTKNRFKMIEKAAKEILNAMAQFKLVQSATVTIHKPAAPVPQVLDTLSVTLSQNY